MTQSRIVTSNQPGPHPRLEEVVRRHLKYPTRRPVHQPTQEVFEALAPRIEAWQGPLIFDSCCGVGESTSAIAKLHPDALVIGLDKSANRLARHQGAGEASENYLLARVDLNDFWRLAVKAGWTLDYHYLLYPTPWPKAGHLQRRWHGSETFSDLVKLKGKLELRSNWKLYLEEFAIALDIAGYQSRLNSIEPDNPITPFERKYQASLQPLWQLRADLS
ncbi:tRNA (guanine(46)-N(7))-methyltransferase TrmB [Dongshaea marina]|uniref:tRNA (guanine(46)-N(7))-methyltransferase TrmB n=1 Tax=Dongshaea marina TaxID=2047966 RepID=UPI000D3E8DCF|nr:SAM-dependent methyltransferase [Dongshaea marina]